MTKTKTAAIRTNSNSCDNTKAVAKCKSKRGRKGLQCRNLSNEQRESLLQSLLKRRETKQHERKGKSSTPSKEALEEVSLAFGVSTKTCKRIWERFLETADDSGSGGDVSHRKHQSGRHKKISAKELVTKIQGLPLETRSSVRGLARALGMPHTTIHRRLKSGEIQLESLLCKAPPEAPNNTKTTPESNECTENTNEALGNQKTKKTTKTSNTKAKSSAANKKIAV